MDTSGVGQTFISDLRYALVQGFVVCIVQPSFVVVACKYAACNAQAGYPKRLLLSATAHLSILKNCRAISFVCSQPIV